MSRGAWRILQLALLFAGAAALTGCDSIREASGAGKQPPDEFAIVTKPPLIIPPDYNLRPPKPGAAPTNQVEPTQAAEEALMGGDTASIAAAMPGNASQGEKLLLANAGAQNADPNIRQDLIADETAMQAASDSLTDKILFWEKPSPQDAAASADATAKPAVGGTAAPAAPADATDSTTIDKSKKSDGGGWFDWF